MKRLLVDFNSIMRDVPEGRVELGQLGAWPGNELPPLASGERILLWDHDIEVEAIAEYDAADRLWLARPDWATKRVLSGRLSLTDDGLDQKVG